ncbi:collagen alpha-1(I) chain-like [Hippopotamus amphibius kiboko]|uniref:collagen alpha-1(I) chain-like n=1 Tax=Hippopotamus amphibius kiboko TaxID=575201 RepID=UPI002595F0FD|nr:collagen alpha-1(I) chain-like [Hippopotamus amphibius kiboko]
MAWWEDGGVPAPPTAFKVGRQWDEGPGALRPRLLSLDTQDNAAARFVAGRPPPQCSAREPRIRPPVPTELSGTPPPPRSPPIVRGVGGQQHLPLAALAVVQQGQLEGVRHRGAAVAAPWQRGLRGLHLLDLDVVHLRVILDHEAVLAAGRQAVGPMLQGSVGSLRARQPEGRSGELAPARLPGSEATAAARSPLQGCAAPQAGPTSSSCRGLGRLYADRGEPLTCGATSGVQGPFLQPKRDTGYPAEERLQTPAEGAGSPTLPTPWSLLPSPEPLRLPRPSLCASLARASAPPSPEPLRLPPGPHGPPAPPTAPGSVLEGSRLPGRLWGWRSAAQAARGAEAPPTRLPRGPESPAHAHAHRALPEGEGEGEPGQRGRGTGRLLALILESSSHEDLAAGPPRGQRPARPGGAPPTLTLLKSSCVCSVYICSVRSILWAPSLHCFTSCGRHGRAAAAGWATAGRPPPRKAQPARRQCRPPRPPSSLPRPGSQTV